MPTRVTDKLLNWASDIEPQTLEQALRASRLPIVDGHVALMPDAHLGIGATVGSVIPTRDAVIPAAVGVDIGCGMIAVRTDLRQDELPDDLDAYLRRLEQIVPAGLGNWHGTPSHEAKGWFAGHKPASDLSPKQRDKVLVQFGTLGSGNHFLEICVDDEGPIWLVLHSGSRGVGNELASRHIDRAKRLAQEGMLSLEDPNLAYFVQGTPEFDAYIGDVLWAQGYARANRDRMMDTAIAELLRRTGTGRETQRINCHHNYTVQERHRGHDLWITRKGAIRAGSGDLGVIPGSMGTASYIVRGLGNADSYESCAHGAGRRMGRKEARRRFTVDDLTSQMGERVWLKGRAEALIDEIPSAYKDIDRVMADQRDLVEVVHVLRGIVNYKGTS
jgi:tRNA-splicing ligase RtcB (3'-phosphate/5'-hydroxy nucleic acid ligase)